MHGHVDGRSDGPPRVGAARPHLVDEPAGPVQDPGELLDLPRPHADRGAALPQRRSEPVGDDRQPVGVDAHQVHVGVGRRGDGADRAVGAARTLVVPLTAGRHRLGGRHHGLAGGPQDRQHPPPELAHPQLGVEVADQPHARRPIGERLDERLDLARGRDHLEGQAQVALADLADPRQEVVALPPRQVGTRGLQVGAAVVQRVQVAGDAGRGAAGERRAQHRRRTPRPRRVRTDRARRRRRPHRVRGCVRAAGAPGGRCAASARRAPCRWRRRRARSRACGTRPSPSARSRSPYAAHSSRSAGSRTARPAAGPRGSG